MGENIDQLNTNNPPLIQLSESDDNSSFLPLQVQNQPMPVQIITTLRSWRDMFQIFSYFLISTIIIVYNLIQVSEVNQSLGSDYISYLWAYFPILQVLKKTFRKSLLFISLFFLLSLGFSFSLFFGLDNSQENNYVFLILIPFLSLLSMIQTSFFRKILLQYQNSIFCRLVLLTTTGLTQWLILTIFRIELVNIQEIMIRIGGYLFINYQVVWIFRELQRKRENLKFSFRLYQVILLGLLVIFQVLLIQKSIEPQNYPLYTVNYFLTPLYLYFGQKIALFKEFLYHKLRISTIFGTLMIFSFLVLFTADIGGNFDRNELLSFPLIHLFWHCSIYIAEFSRKLYYSIKFLFYSCIYFPLGILFLLNEHCYIILVFILPGILTLAVTETLIFIQNRKNNSDYLDFQWKDLNIYDFLLQCYTLAIISSSVVLSLHFQQFNEKNIGTLVTIFNAMVLTLFLQGVKVYKPEEDDIEFHLIDIFEGRAAQQMKKQEKLSIKKKGTLLIFFVLCLVPIVIQINVVYSLQLGELFPSMIIPLTSFGFLVVFSYGCLVIKTKIMQFGDKFVTVSNFYFWMFVFLPLYLFFDILQLENQENEEISVWKLIAIFFIIMVALSLFSYVVNNIYNRMQYQENARLIINQIHQKMKWKGVDFQKPELRVLLDHIYYNGIYDTKYKMKYGKFIFQQLEYDDEKDEQGYQILYRVINQGNLQKSLTKKDIFNSILTKRYQTTKQSSQERLKKKGEQIQFLDCSIIVPENSQEEIQLDYSIKNPIQLLKQDNFILIHRYEPYRQIWLEEVFFAIASKQSKITKAQRLSWNDFLRFIKICRLDNIISYDRLVQIYKNASNLQKLNITVKEFKELILMDVCKQVYQNPHQLPKLIKNFIYPKMAMEFLHLRTMFGKPKKKKGATKPFLPPINPAEPLESAEKCCNEDCMSYISESIDKFFFIVTVVVMWLALLVFVKKVDIKTAQDQQEIRQFYRGQLNWEQIFQQVVTFMDQQLNKDFRMIEHRKFKLNKANLIAIFQQSIDIIGISAIAFCEEAKWGDSMDWLAKISEFILCDTSYWQYLFFVCFGLIVVYLFISREAFYQARTGKLGKRDDMRPAKMCELNFYIDKLTVLIGKGLFFTIIASMLKMVACRRQDDEQLLIDFVCFQNQHIGLLCMGILGFLIYYPAAILIYPNIQLKNEQLDIKYNTSFLISEQQAKLAVVAVEVLVLKQCYIKQQLLTVASICVGISLYTLLSKPCVIRKVYTVKAISYLFPTWFCICAFLQVTGHQPVPLYLMLIGTCLIFLGILLVLVLDRNKKRNLIQQKMEFLVRLISFFWMAFVFLATPAKADTGDTFAWVFLFLLFSIIACASLGAYARRTHEDYKQLMVNPKIIYIINTILLPIYSLSLKFRFLSKTSIMISRLLRKISVQPTPNPTSLKFFPGKSVLQQGTLDIASKSHATISPLAISLFQAGAIRVFYSIDYVTVSVSDAQNWTDLQTPISSIIKDFFDSNTPLLSDQYIEESNYDQDNEVVQIVQQILQGKIRPSVRQDGGDIKFLRYEEATGTIFLELRGSCAGCPSSSVTLKDGIERMLKFYIPEIQQVLAEQIKRFDV